MMRVSVPPELNQLAVLVAAVDEYAAQESLPQAVSQRLQVVIEELFVNAVHHVDMLQRSASFEVFLDRDPDGVSFRVRDNGPQFNPLETPDPETASVLSERSIGGLGLHLVRQLCDDLKYEYVAGHNELRASLRDNPFTGPSFS